MTKNIPALLLAPTILLVCSIAVFAAPQTMRLDYYHTGNSKQESFSVDRIHIEPLPWPSDMGKTIDDTNLGKYFFEVRDHATKRLLYSRGFASIFGEWETTDEATTMMRTFSESLRFPAPDAPVEIVLKKRDAKNLWRDIWSFDVDPRNIFIDRSRVPAPARLIAIQKMGDPATKVDFVILGDGYTAREQKKFAADARRFTEVIFATSPFK
ncbi:MAG: peptidase M64 N-terminal domain-containing protein, partial [Pyrinomonadaceae bacterium]